MKATLIAIAIAIGVGLFFFLSRIDEDTSPTSDTSQPITETKEPGKNDVATAVNPSIDSSAKNLDQGAQVEAKVEELSKGNLPYKYQVDFTDKNSNEITALFLSPGTAEDFKVTEGVVTVGAFLEKYKPLTNKFLRIDHPKSKSGKNVFYIKPSGKFGYIHLYDPERANFERIPFLIKENGVVEVRMDATKAYTIFALTSKQ